MSFEKLGTSLRYFWQYSLHQATLLKKWVCAKRIILFFKNHDFEGFEAN